MAQCLILLVTAAGLGVMLPIRSPAGAPLYGVRFYTGFLAIPIFITVGNLAFRVPLTPLSRGIFFCSIALLAAAVLKELRAPDRAPALLRHPFVGCSLLLLVALVVVRRRPFIPAGWDEFSHWLLMPRQILEYQRLAWVEFPVNDLASYTPGWPILLTYPAFVTGASFQPADYHLTGLVSSIALAALCADVVLALMPRAGSSATRLAVWAIPLIVLGLGSVGPVADRSVLIELPLRQAILACLLLMLLEAAGAISTRKASLLLGVALAGVLLLKRQMWPVTFLAIMVSLAPASLAGRSSVVRGRRVARLALNAALVLTPCLLLAALWDAETPWARQLTAQASQPAPLIDRLAASTATAGLMMDALIAPRRAGARAEHLYWGGLRQSAPTVLGLGGLLGAALLPRYRRVAVAAFAALAGLFFGLAWSYTFYFGSVEGPALAAMERYISTLLLPVRTLGLFFLIVGALGARDWLSTRGVPEAALRAAIGALASIAIVVAFTDLTHAFRGRSGTAAIRRWLGEAELLAAASTNRDARVLLVAQGSDGREWVIGRYASIGRYALPLRAWSFADGPITTWTTPIAEAAFRRTAVDFDVIWVVRSDAWLDRAIGPLLAPGCAPPLERNFLVRTVTANAWQFQCVPKNLAGEGLPALGGASHAAPSLAAQPEGSASSTVNVTWSSVGSGSPADWIGAYRGDEAAYRDWKYAANCGRNMPDDRKPGGSCQFQLGSSGTYEFRLMSGSGTVIAKSAPVVVAGPQSMSLTVSMPRGGPPGAVTVSWTGHVSPAAADWVAAYPDGQATYADWGYASSCGKQPGKEGSAAGSCTFTLARPGTYEFRMFAGGATELARSSSFSIPAGRR